MRAESALIGGNMENRMIGTTEASSILASENKSILILTHSHPDADTLGSAAALALGLRSLGKKVDVLTSGFPERYSFLNKDGVFLTKPDEKDIENEFIDRLIVSVDIAAPSLLGDWDNLFTGIINIAIDHHLGNSIEADLKLLDPNMAACGEIVMNCYKSSVL